MKQVLAYLYDALLVVGAAAIVFGLWMVSRPTACIIGGLMCICASLLLGHRPENKK